MTTEVKLWERCLASSPYSPLTTNSHPQSIREIISAMERVLSTRELVDEIFEIVAQREDSLSERSKRTRTTLPALARTSRFFSPSALRILWRSIWSIDSLLGCLPETVFHRAQLTETSLTDYERLMVVSPDITEADLARLRFYAELVHEYGIDHAWSVYKPYILPDNGYDLLSPLFEDQRLLPRLRKATFSLNLASSMELTRLVLGENRVLDSLSVHGTQTVEVAQGVEWLSSLARLKVQVLHSLKILPHPLDPSGTCQCQMTPSTTIYSLPFGVLEKVVDLGRITFLNIHAIAFDQAEWIRHIAQIPNLKSLLINLSGLTDISNIARSPDNVRFGSLEQAIIVAEAPLALCSLLRLWRPNKLRNLTIKRTSRTHLWDLEEICLSLRQTSISAYNLKTLRFKNERQINREHALNYYDNTTDLTRLALNHLSRFAGLRALVFDLGSRVTWEDDTLQEVAQYWPLLRSFHVCEWEYANPSRISPDGVYMFLMSLPHMDNLTLRFNTTRHLSEEFEPLQHMGLLTWDVCTSDANDTDKVFNFIKDSVPNLKTPSSRWYYLRLFRDNPEDEIHEGPMTDEQKGEARVSAATWKSVEEEWKNFRLPPSVEG